MSTDGQVTLWRRNIAENLNRLSRAHERYRRHTDDRRTDDDSEHELEFTFAKKRMESTSYVRYPKEVELEHSNNGLSQRRPCGLVVAEPVTAVTSTADERRPADHQTSLSSRVA